MQSVTRKNCSSGENLHGNKLEIMSNMVIRSLRVNQYNYLKSKKTFLGMSISSIV